MGVRSGGRNFPAIEFAGKKSPDLAFSNADRYEQMHCGNFHVKKQVYVIRVLGNQNRLAVLAVFFGFHQNYKT